MEKAYILTLELPNYGGCCCEPRYNSQVRVYEDKDEAYRVRDAIRTIVKSEDGWREKSLTKEDLEALKPYLGDRYYGGIWDADIEEIDLVKKVA